MLPQVFARVDVLFPALGEQHSNVGGVRPASLPTTVGKSLGPVALCCDQGGRQVGDDAAGSKLCGLNDSEQGRCPAANQFFLWEALNRVSRPPSAHPVHLVTPPLADLTRPPLAGQHLCRGGLLPIRPLPTSLALPLSPREIGRSTECLPGTHSRDTTRCREKVVVARAAISPSYCQESAASAPARRRRSLERSCW
jgi:hypothetical protein